MQSSASILDTSFSEQGNVSSNPTSAPDDIETEQACRPEDQKQPLLEQAAAFPIYAIQDIRGGQADGEASTSGREAFETEGLVNHASVLKRVNWHIIPLFFLLAMLCATDRSNLSFVASELSVDLGFSDEDYGYGSGIFFVGYALFAIPSTFVCVRMGAPAFLGSILVLWGVTASLFAVMQNIWQFFLLRLILGLAESGAYPGMWYHLSLFYTEQEMVPVYAIIATASSISGMIGGVLAGELLKMDGVLGFRGWQWLFVLESIPAMLLGAASILWLARSPSEAKFLCPEEQLWLETRKSKARLALEGGSAKEDSPDEKAPKASLETFLLVLRDWRIWWLASIWAVVCFGIDGLTSWIPLLLQSIIFGESLVEADSLDEEARKQLNANAIYIARLSSIPFGLAALGMVLIAFSAKKYRDRHWHIAVPMFIGTALLVALPLMRGLSWLKFGLLSMGAVCVWAPHGPLLTWPAAIMHGTTAAAGFALVKTVGAFASFAGSAAFGELHHLTGTFAVPLVFLGGIFSVGAVLALTFREPGPSF